MLRQQHHHNYEIVENGQDAVNITAEKEFDLILMVRPCIRCRTPCSGGRNPSSQTESCVNLKRRADPCAKCSRACLRVAPSAIRD